MAQILFACSFKSDEGKNLQKGYTELSGQKGSLCDGAVTKEEVYSALGFESGLGYSSGDGILVRDRICDFDDGGYSVLSLAVTSYENLSELRSEVFKELPQGESPRREEGYLEVSGPESFSFSVQRGTAGELAKEYRMVGSARLGERSVLMVDLWAKDISPERLQDFHEWVLSSVSRLREHQSISRPTTPLGPRPRAEPTGK
ncbi:MAG: hypothetical protein ACRC0L_08830 [Angustibacter sp.]